jgi:hypothetical protein
VTIEEALPKTNALLTFWDGISKGATGTTSQLRENLEEDLLAYAEKVRVDALKEAGRLVRGHVFGKVDAEYVADFLDSRAARLLTEKEST